MVQNGPRMTQNDPKWPKNDPKWPKITPKWPKNDARIYALFLQFFFTEKSGSANFFAFRMYGGGLFLYLYYRRRLDLSQKVRE